MTKQEHREYAKKYRKEHRQKILEYNKIYKQNHKVETKEYAKKYDKKRYLKNKGKFLSQMKEYYQENKNTIIKQHLEYQKNRLKKDVSYKIIRYLRARIWSVLKGITKSDTTKKLIGCTIDQLKVHLENQFTEGMSWENYGKWHVDHIRPCSSFNLTNIKEQKRCFNYTNLQPLWAVDNLIKSDKII
jgi:hypothetical protein